MMNLMRNNIDYYTISIINTLLDGICIVKTPTIMKGAKNEFTK